MLVRRGGWSSVLNRKNTMSGCLVTRLHDTCIATLHEMATCSRNTTPKHRVPAPGTPWPPQHPSPFAFLLSSFQGAGQKSVFGAKKAGLSPGTSRGWKNRASWRAEWELSRRYSTTGTETERRVDRAGRVPPHPDTFTAERQPSSASSRCIPRLTSARGRRWAQERRSSGLFWAAGCRTSC